MTREVLQQALAVLRGCLEHPDAVDAIAAIEFELASAAPPTTRSFKKLYEDNAQGIEIERLKMRLEAAKAATIAQEPTSAEYAQGYAAGFNDACRPVQPAISIDALVAEFESTPSGLDEMNKGRQWVRETLVQPVPPEQDWEAVAADQALTIAMMKCEQEPVEYQMRMRPTWEVTSWSDWKKCSRNSFNDYTKTPKLHDWEYEARELYAQAIIQAIPQIPQEHSSKREWVGLTKQDTWEIAENCGLADEAWLDVMNAIEAKLKERNT